MSGILDSKTRILDTILTTSGKRQLASGKLRINFCSFTDRDTFYSKDMISGSSNAQDRIFFESSNMLHDQITFETDDSQRLINFLGADLSLVDGNIVSGTQSDRTAHGVVSGIGYVEGTGYPIFASLSDQLLSSSIQNFQKMQYIGKRQLPADTSNNTFAINRSTGSFEITDTSPINTESEVTSIDLVSIEPLMLDLRLAHFDQFKFLPPILPDTQTSIEGDLIAGYADINQREITNFEELSLHLDNKPYEEVEFTQTSKENNLVCQMFEVDSESSNLTKLDVIDFGEFNDGGTNRRVFFTGKIFIDSIGLPTFVNLFTLVFE